MLPSVEMIPLSPDDVSSSSCCSDDQVAMETFSKAFTVYRTKTALDVESSWTQALANNNVTAISNWIQSDLAKSNAGVDGSLANFGAWIQKMAVVNKKELISLCFRCCRDLWMYLDQQSFTRIHLLLQRLRNLLSFTRWGRSHVSSTHHWPVMEGGHWEQERRSLEQHIWLGRLVQWWGTTGLLLKSPDCHETKRISQMWREMDQNHRRACQGSPGEEKEGSSLIQGMVSTVNKQHGPVWTSGDTPQRCYPPPSLQALLKLVLVPQIDSVSVQAILMYFVLDVTNFLQCRDDLLRSFSFAFSIPPAFCRQVKGLWLLDHGLISQSMDLLLSPRSRHPWLASQHRPIVEALLRRGMAPSALRYLFWNRPAIGNVQDIKLHIDVFLQNRCISEAWSLLKESKVRSDDIIRDFLCACGRPDLRLYCVAHMTTLDKGPSDSRQTESHSELSDAAVGQCGEGLLHCEKLNWKEPGQEITGLPPRPFSAWLYSSQGSLSSLDVLTLLRGSVLELEKPRPPARNSWEVVWPKHVEKSLDHSALSLCHVNSSPPSAASSCEFSPRSSDEESEPWPFVDSPAESHAHSLSMDSSESVRSFTTASNSVVPLGLDVQSVDESLWASQFGLPAGPYEREFQGAEEETSRSSREPGFEDMVLGCLNWVLTQEATTDRITFNSLSKETAEDLIHAVSCDGGIDESRTWSAMTEDSIVTAEGATGFPLGISCTTDARGNRGGMNLHPQFYSNEDNQSDPDNPMKSDNFLSPEYDKMGYTKVVPEEMYSEPQQTEVLKSGMCSHQKSKKLFFQEPLPKSTFCYLDLEPLQKAPESDSAMLEERGEVFQRGFQEAEEQPEILTSSALSEASHGSSTDPQNDGDDCATNTQALPETGLSRSNASLLEMEINLVVRGRYKQPFSLQEQPKQLQTPKAPLSARSNPARVPQPHPAGQSRDRVPSGRTSPEKEAACFRSSSDRLGDGKLGSWWKQALETPKASTGLLPITSQTLSITPDEKGPRVGGRSNARSPVTFQGHPTKEKGGKCETKEVGKDVPVGRGPCKSLHRTEESTGAQRGAFVKRGKRVKKA